MQKVNDIAATMMSHCDNRPPAAKLHPAARGSDLSGIVPKGDIGKILIIGLSGPQTLPSMVGFIEERNPSSGRVA
ncbi:hypothetical protein [Pararhizobium sp. PWRC1-1]|uniref:hypothetical protein n=1 Tax=Pararhizobium sp. PWRC1-1 TaxID=2804566 RepID=UPI003CEB1561